METPPTIKQKVLENAAIVPRAVWLRQMGDNAICQFLSRCRLESLFGLAGLRDVLWQIGARDADDENIRERKLLFMRWKSPFFD